MTGGAPSLVAPEAAAGGQIEGEQQQQQQQRLRYRGVRLRKWGSWVAEVRFPNSRERLWLGSYATAEQAARAFDAAVYCLRGPDAEFNFPGEVPEIPNATELSREEIRAAAALFAGQHGGEPIRLGDEGSSAGEVTAMEAASVSAGERTTTTTTTTTTMSVGVSTGSEFYITATAEASDLWNEEEAAVYSLDDIYSNSPLWNFTD